MNLIATSLPERVSRKAQVSPVPPRPEKMSSFSKVKYLITCFEATAQLQCTQ